ASITNLTVTLSSVTTNQAIPTTPGYGAATFTPWNGAVDWTASGPVAYLPPWVNGDIQVLLEAYWNLTLLSDDNTFGIHNPTFFNGVIANTSAQLEGVQYPRAGGTTRTRAMSAIKWSAALAVLLALGCTGPEGAAGPRGPRGQAGPTGPSGTVPATNTVRGMVTDSERPLRGVAVTVQPGGATAITDGAGAFSLPSLDVGVYDISFQLAGFIEQTVTVAVPAGAPVKVSVALDREGDGGAGGPAVAVSDQLTAGCGTSITVPAHASGNGPLTYAWTQTGGPPATLAGAGTATLAFTTRDLASSLGPRALSNARFDALGID